MLEIDKPLPFTEETQEAIVGHCLINHNFFLKCSRNIKGGWFTGNILLGNIYDAIKDFYESNGEFLKSVEEFKGCDFFLEQKIPDRQKYYELVDRCVYSANSLFSLEKLQRNLTGWIRESLFKESIEGAARRFKQQGLASTYDWTKAKILEIQKATFEDDQMALSFKDPETWVMDEQKNLETALSTGCKVLDDALGGGLFRSETCAILASVNTGKSSFMLSLVRHAIKQKKKVLWIVHEGNARKLRARLLASFIGISYKTLLTWMKMPDKKKLINQIADHIDQFLVYLPYVKTTGMFVEDLMEEIKKRHEDLKLRTGSGFDLVVDDYPAKLRSRAGMLKKEGLLRTELAMVYDTFEYLAAELNCHCFVAVQTNRSGLKINNKSEKSDRLINAEDVNESFGIVQNLANIISLTRTPEDKKKNILRLSIAKSRNDETDITVITRTNYNCALTHGDKEMIDTKGLWDTEVKGNYLAAYMVPDNTMRDTDELDESLRSIEDKSNPEKGRGSYMAGVSDKIRY